MVGQIVGGKLAELGHDVMLGTRTPSELDTPKRGGSTLREWQGATNANIGTFEDTAKHGEVLVNATNGGASLEALHMAGEANLDGKVLIDVANPLDFSKGFPPTLAIKDTDSLAETIQRAFPNVKVVKTLNTMNASVMVNPKSVAEGRHTVFVSGNDAAAKATVTTLLRAFGWTDVLDLGGLETARGTEMLLPIWLRTMGALGHANFNFHVAR